MPPARKASPGSPHCVIWHRHIRLSTWSARQSPECWAKLGISPIWNRTCASSPALDVITKSALNSAGWDHVPPALFISRLARDDSALDGDCSRKEIEVLGGTHPEEAIPVIRVRRAR